MTQATFTPLAQSAASKISSIGTMRISNSYNDYQAASVDDVNTRFNQMKEDIQAQQKVIAAMAQKLDTLA